MKAKLRGGFSPVENILYIFTSNFHKIEQGGGRETKNSVGTALWKVVQVG